MPHDHHRHDHHHLADLAGAGGDRRVVWAVAVNLGLTIAQIVAGVISGSLALVADAIHNMSDALSLVIALYARRIGRRPADEAMTFGYGRAEVVAAMVNYTTLIVIALYLAAEGVQRLFDPVEIAGWIVVIVAGIALVVDTVTALLVFRLSRDSVNMRAAFLHNLADAMGSVAVIFAGTLILLYDWRLIDPIVTLLISGYILWHAGQGIRPVIRILMLGAPGGLSLPGLVSELESIPGVANIHHLHVWHMHEHESALEAHVALTPGADAAAVKHALKSLLQERFGIVHSVLEIETSDETCARPQVIGH